jgi:hypothetical protein
MLQPKTGESTGRNGKLNGDLRSRLLYDSPARTIRVAGIEFSRMLFKLKDRVRRVGQEEVRTVEDIREPDEHVLRFVSPAAETMYWIQLGSVLVALLCRSRHFFRHHSRLPHSCSLLVQRAIASLRLCCPSAQDGRADLLYWLISRLCLAGDPWRGRGRLKRWYF